MLLPPTRGHVTQVASICWKSVVIFKYNQWFMLDSRFSAENPLDLPDGQRQISSVIEKRIENKQ